MERVEKMKFLKHNRGKIIIVVTIIFLMTFTYFWGGNVPRENNTENNISFNKENLSQGDSLKTNDKTEDINETETSLENTSDFLYSENHEMMINEDSDKDQYLTEPVPEGRPTPVEPQNITICDKKMSCTLTIRCDTILKNIDFLDEAKKSLIPPDGIILAKKKVVFYEGESAFDVLLRETHSNNIHMEYVNTPIYNSAYIEGIHNLYEFDCGELSGWMYSVNGWFPNYGCSRYALKEGDNIEWVYTCNLGRDVK